MFVPRVLRLKCVKGTKSENTAAPAKDSAASIADSHEDTPVKAPAETSTTSPAPESHKHITAVATRGSNFTPKKAIPASYHAQLVAGVELLFSDYAHQARERSDWLEQRYRNIEEGDKFVHLSTIFQHPYFTGISPQRKLSQKALSQALVEVPSEILELSKNHNYVRRVPSSYPPPYLPENSFDVVDDDGLGFWDQRTIYVEPHNLKWCLSPAKVAQHLKDHGQLKPTWLPIQAVYTLGASSAFVVLSGNVLHEEVWQKWRAYGKPTDWKIMTKVEHTRRTAEYVALLQKENPKEMRKRRVDETRLPPVARPATLALDVEITPPHPQAPRKLSAIALPDTVALVADTAPSNPDMEAPGEPLNVTKLATLNLNEVVAMPPLDASNKLSATNPPDTAAREAEIATKSSGPEPPSKKLESRGRKNKQRSQNKRRFHNVEADHEPEHIEEAVESKSSAKHIRFS